MSAIHNPYWDDRFGICILISYTYYVRACNQEMKGFRITYINILEPQSEEEEEVKRIIISRDKKNLVPQQFIVAVEC